MMVVTSTSDYFSGFSVQFDDKVVFKVAKLPDYFVFQSTDSNNYFLSREPLNFFSRGRTVLSNPNRIEIAAVESRMFYKRLRVGNKDFRIRLKVISWLAMFFGKQYFEIKELGIRIDLKERFFCSEACALDNGQDPVRLAVIVLLQFSELHRLRESTS